MGMSQRELAERIGVSTGAIGNYESGLRRPKFETLEALADVLNVPLPALIGDEQTARLLMVYDQLHNLIDLAIKLDDTDRAKLEERAAMLLEADKYNENP
jgi:transcriptional regulator with XRE-family HTH domain